MTQELGPKTDEVQRPTEHRDDPERLRASLDLADEQIRRGESAELTSELLVQLAREAHDNALRRVQISSDVQP
jgi:hypothetical protein